MIPHLAVPFRIENGSAATIEQDSEDDVLQSVRVLITTPLGSRLEVPTYGVPQALGHQSTFPVTNSVLAGVAQWEPRARVDVTTQIDSYDSLVREIDVRVSVV
jgi:phage baseplate assembly protein W